MTPKVGEVYQQFGYRILVSEVDEDTIVYVARFSNGRAFTRKIPHEEWRFYLDHGLLTRVMESAA